ncbi:NRR repressor [Canna indica]|uniref:NRR repressor n=1 Tax=Canna indica TaxID=4628 RepID=A0AAQ3KDZ8_9LILI|nr:NRR repressor [Canna indica]
MMSVPCRQQSDVTCVHRTWFPDISSVEAKHSYKSSCSLRLSLDLPHLLSLSDSVAALMEKGSGAGKRPRPATPPAPTPRTEPDGDDDREEDMEKFYALLHNIRAARDLIRTSNGNLSKRQKPEAAPPPPPPLWRPVFALEDFKNQDEPGSAAESTALINPSRSTEVKEEGEEDKSVDLSLSL